MNDRQDPYGPGEPPRTWGYVQEGHDHGPGYDEYGRPLPVDPPRQYDPYRDAGGHGGAAYGTDPHGTDPYGTGAYGTAPHGTDSHGASPYGADVHGTGAYGYAPDPYGTGSPDGYAPGAYGQDAYAPGYAPDHTQGGHPSAPDTGGVDPYGDGWTTAPADTGRPPSGPWVPQQPQGPWYEDGSEGPAGPGREADGGTTAPAPADVPGGGLGDREGPSGPERPGARDDGPDAPDGEYRTEEFSFVEEQDEESEDVIDWLKFSESRTERREEAKRRGRNRMVALAAVLAVALVAGVGWLWYAGVLPGASEGGDAEQAAGGAQKRQVIVVHLREIDGGETSTVLLVDNETARRGTTVLLPNSLAVSSGTGGGGTTLGKAFESEGAAATRDALGLLLGTEIRGTWRLDTPYLHSWVDLVGGITLDADTTVPGAEKGDDPLVEQGKDRDLDGEAAVAYATHRADGEPQTEQLARFGQVVQATLTKMSDDPATATKTVRALTQILDPSLTDAQLGASLAELAGYAKKGDYSTELLPVEDDGTLSDETGRSLVKDILGGTVKNTDPDATPRVSLRDAGGDEDAATAARVALVNGGYTVVGAGSAGSTQATTRVTYSDEANRAKAVEVARTLGLSEEAVSQGRGAANADVTVVLGKDYEPRG
ncbi:LytR family transcriptional regulator [Streptomyces sp. TRM43335]|uniref:LytR family transcriptional regulator n=1 Tax=Streptomyces taklimakanensis TaxID=2569853 RepID=A0A6G2BAU9_9ACTN|nr:LytR family transcriptional regulator [Streptomyces taklimakanensis]